MTTSDRELNFASPGLRPAEQESVETSRILEWQFLYEWVYDVHDPGNPYRDPGNDFAGWYNSYTKEPYPDFEMADWRDSTVRRIKTLHPRRVLEIGVGSGLLLTELARDTEEYVGTDFSRSALDRLAARVAAAPDLTAQVRLENRHAGDFTGLARRHFDTVILNSVVQYFPSAAYLRRVLAGAFECLLPGGAVFIGDVRDLRLHRAFHTGIEITAIEAADDPVVARNVVEDSVAAERELLLHPAFFTAIPAVAATDVRLKRARFRNEMSAHRYDVVLFSAEAPVIPAKAPTVLDWAQIESLETVAEALAHAGTLRVTRIPNARVRHELKAQRLLDTLAPPSQVVQILRQSGDDPTPDPERFCELGDELGFETVVTSSAGETPELLDVTFLLPQPGKHFAASPVGPCPQLLTNDPLTKRRHS